MISGGERLTERFSFHPAPLRSAQDWALDGEMLQTPDGTVDLRQVRSARLVEKAFRGTRMRRLDLMMDEGVHRIALTIGISSGQEHPDRVAHLGLMRAVAGAMAQYCPDVTVEIGEGPRARMVMFAVGLLALAAAVGLGGAIIASGLSMDRMMAAALPLVLMLALGVTVSYSSWPWRTLPSLAAALLPDRLAKLDRFKA